MKARTALLLAAGGLCVASGAFLWADVWVLLALLGGGGA